MWIFLGTHQNYYYQLDDQSEKKIVQSISLKNLLFNLYNFDLEVDFLQTWVYLVSWPSKVLDLYL